MDPLNHDRRRGDGLVPQDYAPISDMRASADYRLHSARNLLLRYFLEDQGTPTRVLEVHHERGTNPLPHDAAPLHVTGTGALCR
jgi:hypothetical protein